MNLNPFKKPDPAQPVSDTPPTTAPANENAANLIRPQTQTDPKKEETPLDYTNTRDLKLSAADRLNAIGTRAASGQMPSPTPDLKNTSDTAPQKTEPAQQPPQEQTAASPVRSPQPQNEAPSIAPSFDVDAIEDMPSSSDAQNPPKELTPSSPKPQSTIQPQKQDAQPIGAPSKEAIAQEHVLQTDFPAPSTKNVPDGSTPTIPTAPISHQNTSHPETIPTEPELTILEPTPQAEDITDDETGLVTNPSQDLPSPETPLENTLQSEAASARIPENTPFEVVPQASAAEQEDLQTTEAASPETETLEKEESEEVDIPAIRTFKADVNKAMKDQKSTLVSMVLAEQRKKLKQKEERSPKSKKNMTLIMGSLGLFVAGVVVVFFALSSIIPSTPSGRSFQPEAFLIAADDHAEIALETLSRGQLIDTLTTQRIESQRLDTIRNLYFTYPAAASADTEEAPRRRLAGPILFFEHLDAEVPPALTRTIGDRFMLGIHSFDNNYPFIILKTTFYENAFAGMLSWESTLPQEFISWFGLPHNRSEVQSLSFHDEVIRNKDVRSVRMLDGRPVVMYSFIDRNTIVITNSEHTLNEVVRRLQLPTPTAQ